MQKSIFALLALALLVASEAAPKKAPLKSLRDDEGCTLYQILMGVSTAAFAVAGVGDLVLGNTVANQNVEIADKDKLITDLKQSNQKLSEDNVRLTSENVQLTEANKKLAKTVDTQKILIDSLTEDIKKKTTQIDELRNIINQQKADILYLTLTNALYSRIIQTQRTSIATYKAELAKKDAKIVGLEASIVVLKKLVNDSAITINTLSAQNNVLKATVTLLRQATLLQMETIKARDKTIVDQKTVISVRDAQLIESAIEKNIVSKVMDMMGEELKAALAQVKELTTQLADANKKVETLTAENAGLKTQLAEANKKVETLTAENAGLKTQLAEANKKVDTLTAENASLKKQVADLTASNAKLKALVIELDTSIIALKGKVASLTKLVADFNTKFQNYMLPWVQYQILMQETGKKVQLDRIYNTSTGSSCAQKDVRKIIGTAAPSVFIANDTEGMVFGGYTTQTFAGTEKWKTDPKAFTFSLSTLSRCKNKNSDGEEAIYALDHSDDDYDVLGFGHWDIWIPDNCMTEKTQIRLEDSTYECPRNGIENFYTTSNRPTLVSFDFYKVTIA